MKLFMSLNKSSIHPSLNYLSKMNAPCIHFHRSAFRAALKEELWNNPTHILRNTDNVNKAEHGVRAHSSLGEKVNRL